jgi:hypothetical protein
MKRIAIAGTIAAAGLLNTLPARAQIGWSVTFDPTQAAHVVQQIAQAEKLYTTTIQTTQNVINGYNLAKRMASSPQSLYTSYGSGLPTWLPMLPTQNTYGNTGAWLASVNKYTGQTTSAIQSASVARVAQLTGYNQLDAQDRQAIAAQTATLDLNDSVNATNLQTVGSIRAADTQRTKDIANLEAASHSLDPSQQTELATLQRINQALLLMLRNQQDMSQLLQGQTLSDTLQGKEQQDAMKSTFQLSQNYETNYKAAAGPSSADAITKALSY